MHGVARLDGDVELGPLGRHVEEQPAMLDLEDIGAELAQPSGDLAQHAGPVGNGEAERHDAVLALEFAHHDGGENPRINVAAAENQPHLAAAEFVRLGQHGGKPGRAGALRHGLLQGEIGVHRTLEMRLIDEDNVGDERAHDGERQRADVLHRNAFGERGAAERTVLATQRVPERGIERGLGANDLHRRLHRARRDGAACDQPAAADRDHQGIEVEDVLQHLERDGALPRDDQRIVIGVHEGEPALARDALGAHLRLRHAFAVEHDLGAMRLGRLHFHEWRGDRHANGGGDA
jgi:hypothetical protein